MKPNNEVSEPGWQSLASMKHLESSMLSQQGPDNNEDCRYIKLVPIVLMDWGESTENSYINPQVLKLSRVAASSGGFDKMQMDGPLEPLELLMP